MADILGIANYVQGQGELGRQRKRENLLANAASRAFAATPGEADAAIQEAIAVDPRAGFQIAGEVMDEQTRRGQTLYNMARGLKQIHASRPEAAASFYQTQLVPGLRRLGFEVQDTYDEARVMPVVDQVLAQFQPAGQSGVQSTKILDNGNIGIVTRGGQVVDTGQKASPTTRLIEQEGEVPFLVTTSGGRVGETTQIGVPVQAPPVGASVGQTRVAIDGVPADQAQRIASVAETMRAAGFPDAQIDAWVSQQSDAAPAMSTPMGPTPVRTPTRAETAASEAQARAGVELANYDRMTQLEAERAAATTRARETAEKQAEARAGLSNALSTADELTALIDQAVTHPGRATATGVSASLDPRNRLPGTDATNFRVLLDQIKGQTFLQAFNSLKGAGAITETEGKKASEAIGRLNTAQSDEEFVSSLNALKGVIARGREKAIQRAGGGGGVARPTTEAEYNALASGALFIDPDDGRQYRKP